MDTRLLELRSNTYAAATGFHRVAAAYFIALRDRKGADENQQIVIALEESTAVYANALDDLLDYLRALGDAPGAREELQRVSRIRELL